MKQRLLIAFLLGALLASAGLNYKLWSRGSSRPAKPAGDNSLQNLRLTPEQMEDLKQRGSSMLAMAREIRVQLRATQTEVQEVLRLPELDVERLDALLARVDELRRQEVELYRDTVLAVRGVLDHDQVAALHRTLQGGSAD